MFTVSENYRAAIAAPSRTERLTGTLQPPGGAAIALDDSVVQAGSLAIENQCLNGEELAFGAVYAGQLTLRLRTDAMFDGGLRPHAYCLPVLKREAHRLAARRLAVGRSPDLVAADFDLDRFVDQRVVGTHALAEGFAIDEGLER